MAIGTQADIFRRLKLNLVNWFGDDSPVLDALLQGIANSQSYIYETQVAANAQTRLTTTTGTYLDLFSQDFLGNTVPRGANQNDATYRKIVQSNILQVKATRPALYSALLELTGIPPILFEPWRPADTGCYGGVNSTNYNMGYGVAGLYGSGSLPYQGFVTVFTDPYQGMANYPGYNAVQMGYGAYGGLATGWYGSATLIREIISDQDIYNTINLTKTYGTIVWVSIVHGTTPPATNILYDSDGDILYDDFGNILLAG